MANLRSTIADLFSRLRERAPARLRTGRSLLLLPALLVVLAAVLAALLLPASPSSLLRPCGEDPVALPDPPPTPDGRPANFLHTCGSRLYDARGRAVRIAGINWFGM